MDTLFMMIDRLGAKSIRYGDDATGFYVHHLGARWQKILNAKFEIR